MIWHAIGEVLPLALVVAFNPFTIMATLAALGGVHGTRSGAAFTAGWAAGLAALTAVAVVFSNALDAASSPAWLDVAHLLLGLAVVGLAVRTWLTRPRSPDEREIPAWMQSMATVAPPRSAGLGLALATLNPKNMALVAAGGSIIGHDDLALAQTVLVGSVFVLLGSSGALGCVALASFGGAGGRRALDGVNGFMADHGEVVLAAVLLLIGVTVVGDALGDLGVR